MRTIFRSQYRHRLVVISFNEPACDVLTFCDEQIAHGGKRAIFEIAIRIKPWVIE